jgi:hypothetical protein
VEFPLLADPRNTQANALLMLAFLDGERLAKRLTEAAYEGSISPTERDRRLHALQERLTQLRYDEEARSAPRLIVVRMYPGLDRHGRC